MVINLKLGDITSTEIAAFMDAQFLSLSESTPLFKINNITTEIGEITRNTLFVVSEDNSLAEMMAAAKKGAHCLLCTKAPASLEKISDTAVIVCDSIGAAIERFAKEYVKRAHYKTIALTGSKGKTRTGEFIYSVLEEMYKVQKATDRKGVARDDAMALLEIPADADFFLFEMKFGNKKDISRLARLIDCDIGIITSLHSDIERNANLDALSGLKVGGEIALSADDEELSLICQPDLNAKYVSVRNESAELRAVNIRESTNSTLFDIKGKSTDIRDVEIHCKGLDNVYSALFAALIGLRYGVPDAKIKTGLKNFHSSELGLGIYTVGGMTFIEDSASATHDSMRSAVDTLCQIAKLHPGSRKIALLGDIRDFGQDTRVLHERMGEHVVAKGIDRLFTFGVAAEQIGVGARRAGMSAENVSGNLNILSPMDSAQALASVLRQGDVLLIKVGRPGVAAEISNFLKSKFENDNGMH